MAWRTGLWGRLSLTTTVIASLFVVAGSAAPQEAAATYPGENGRILFSSASHGGFWTINPDGTGPREIFPEGNAWPSFSPDGTKIAARVGGEQVWVVKADGTNPRQLPAAAPDCNGVYGTTWSPDGTRVAFGKQCGNIFPTFVTNVDGSGQATRLTTFSASYPAWSPDGAKIAFQASSNIWVMNADGTNPVQLTTGGDNRGVAWSPDSQRLIFSRFVQGDGNFRVVVMNPDGSGLAALTPNDAVSDVDPVFSPDGTRIAFVEYETLKIMDADGSNATKVAPVIDGITMRASSPDWGVGAPPAAGAEAVYGTEGSDTASGTNGDDLYYARGGDDTYSAGSGNDSAYGEAGNDSISGGAGNDLVDGGTNNDAVNGGDGNDTVKGGGGNDTLNGDGANVAPRTDTNNTRRTWMAAGGTDVLLGGGGRDKLTGGAGVDSFNGGAGVDVCIVDSRTEKNRAKGCETIRLRRGHT